MAISQEMHQSSVTKINMKITHLKVIKISQGASYTNGIMMTYCKNTFADNWNRCWLVNSLTAGIFKGNFRYVIFKQILVIDGWGISCEIALIWMSLDFTDDQSTLVQVMAWCHQATSHYLNQCWPRSPKPYGVTRPQWVNSLWPSDATCNRRTWSTLVQVMDCHLFSAKPLPGPMLTYCKLDYLDKISVKLKLKSRFHSRKCIWKCCLQNGSHFVEISMR